METNATRRKKNILIIVQHLCRGGAEKSAAKLSVDLAGNYNVHIVTFFSNRDYETTFEYEGLLLPMNQSSKGGLFKKVLCFFSRVFFLRKIKKQYQIDCSISFMVNADIANLLSRTFDKVVVSIRTSKDIKSRKSVNRWLFRNLYKSADCLIVQNSSAELLLRNNIGINAELIKIIPNYFDIKAIVKKAEADIAIDTEASSFFILGHISRLYPVKGQFYLLRIFNELRKSSDKYRLLIVGEGDLKLSLLDYSKKLNLRAIFESSYDSNTIRLNDADVFFAGFDPNPYKYLRFMDVFLFTSLLEGFPNALAEAMICGKVVVSTNCDTGPMDLIGYESEEIKVFPHKTDYGYLMPTFNAVIPEFYEPLSEAEIAWVELIRILSSNKFENQNMGKMASLRMKEYDKTEVIGKWFNLINGIC